MFENDTPIYRVQGPFGIPIEIGASILFLAFVFFGFDLSSPQVVIHGVMMFAMVLASILLHELGHAWAAWIQGVPVQRVVLYGGGGFCEHESSSAYESEFIVAMGPLMNLTLWAVSSLLGGWLMTSVVASLSVGQIGDVQAEFWLTISYWLHNFAWLNLVLFALNMVPIQPLDGGKLLHLVLLRVVPQMTALRVAGAVGLIFSCLWVPAMVGLFMTFGWALLFLPSIGVHWLMVRGNVPA